MQFERVACDCIGLHKFGQTLESIEARNGMAGEALSQHVNLLRRVIGDLERIMTLRVNGYLL